MIWGTQKTTDYGCSLALVLLGSSFFLVEFFPVSNLFMLDEIASLSLEHIERKLRFWQSYRAVYTLATVQYP